MSPKSCTHPGLLADRPSDVDLDTVRVTVQSGALVTLGHVRQPVSRLEGELPVDLGGVVTEFLGTCGSAG